MPKGWKLFLQGLLIGAVTMVLGAGIIKLMHKEQPVKPLLFSLFLLGFVLFFGIEILGGHRQFCKTYNSI